MTDLLDPRRRRAIYRASHRGTKEMDWMLGRFAGARVAGMSEAELAAFERLILLPDPDLQAWLMEGGGDAASDLGPLLATIRAFHGLGETTAM